MSDTLFQQLNSNSFQQDLETIKQKEKPITQTINPDTKYLAVFFGGLVIVAGLVKVTPIIIENIFNYCVANASTLIPTATGLVGTTTTGIAYKVKANFDKQKQLISSFNEKEKSLNKKLEDTKTLYQVKAKELETLKTELQSVNNLLTTKEEAIISLETEKQSALDEVIEISQKLKEVKEVVKVEPIIEAKPIQEEEIDLSRFKISNSDNEIDFIIQAKEQERENKKSKNLKLQKLLEQEKEDEDLDVLTNLSANKGKITKFQIQNATNWGDEKIETILKLSCEQGILRKAGSVYKRTDK